MRRLTPVLTGLVGSAVLYLVLVGGADASEGGGIPMLVWVIGVPALVGLAVWSRRGGRRVADHSWGHAVAASPRGPVARPPASTWAVVRTLGRVEARELTTSGWFGIGLGFSVLVWVVFGLIYAADASESWNGYLQYAPWFAHPLVGLVIVAMHRAVTRAERDGAAELFESCPVDQTTRTAGFLVVAIVPVVALAVVLAAVYLTNLARSPLLHGPVGGDSAMDLVGAVLLGAGGVALGVALGRWVRFALVPIAAVIAIAIATGAINAIGGAGWNPLVELATAPTMESPSPVFEDRAPVWHVAWIVGLTVGVAVIAVARHRRDRRVLVASLAAAAVLVVAGVGATRPMSSGSAARVADLIAHPEDHQVCTSLPGPVDVCAFPVHRELLDHVVERVGPIAAALPPELPRVTLRQSYDGQLADLPPEVRRRLSPDDLRRPAREVPLDYTVDELEPSASSSFDVAFGAVGLPSEAGVDHLPLVVSGEARGVVALWLAARGLDRADAVEVASSPNAGSADAFERGSTDEGGACSVPSVVWSAQDLAAGRALIALSEHEVRDVLLGDWARWTDPRTGTDELLAALGLAGVAPFDHVEPIPGEPC